MTTGTNGDDALKELLAIDFEELARWRGRIPLRKEIIRLEQVSRTYSKGAETIRSLDDVSLTINGGEFVAIVGASGSGKSTLMHIIGALDTLSSGTITIDNADITNMEEDMKAVYRRKHIGFIFQTFNLQNELSARENVELPLMFDRIPGKKRREMSIASLERVGLGNRINHRPTEMSGGQQQRVAIARAIVNKPAILLADEPTGDLDSKSGKEIMQLLINLTRKDDMTILMVTHNEEHAKYAERILHMLDGKIVDEEKGDML